MGEKLTDSMRECIQKIIDKDKSDIPFLVTDFADVLYKAKYWKKNLPRIRIFFAIKSNFDPVLLKFLVSIGCGFDCASLDEMESALLAGSRPCDIIYGQPVKPLTHLRYAQSVNIDLMTFDSEHELKKIKNIFPTARLVIRIVTPPVKCFFPLSDKFGCEMTDVRPLLQLARKLHLQVVGVSFHVGSLCEYPEAYSTAIRLSREVVDIAEEVGYHLKLLDIGGGYLGASSTLPMFDQMSVCINQSLDKYFPDKCGMEIIAEPGNYLVDSSGLLCTKIIGKKIKAVKGPDGLQKNVYFYYMNDGQYTSFNCLLTLKRPRIGFGMAPFLSQEEEEKRKLVPCKLWGVTCSSADFLAECQAPEMEEGEHFIFFNMGAYTHCLATRFNGFPFPNIYHIFSEHSWYEKEGVLSLDDFLNDLKVEQLNTFLSIRDSIRSGNTQ